MDLLLPDDEKRVANTPAAVGAPPASSGFQMQLPPDPAPTQLATSTVRSVIDVPPERAAKANAISSATGMPLDVVLRNFDEEAANQKLMDIRRNMVESPILARQLSDPKFAAIAHDDTSNLSSVSGILKTIGTMGRAAIAAPTYNFGAASYGLAEGVAKAIAPDSAAASWLEARRKGTQAFAKNFVDADPNAGFIERAWVSGAASTGQMAPGLIATIITKNPSLLLTTMGVTTGGESVAKGLDAGLSPVRALNYGMQDAAAEVLPEIMPLGIFLKDLKAGAPFLKIIGHQILAEVPSEMVTTAWQKFNEYANLTPEKPFTDYLKSLPEAEAETIASTLATLLLTGGFGKVAHSSLKMLSGKNDRSAEAERNAQAFAALLKAGEQSKVRERDPASYARFVQEAAADGPVTEAFIDANALVTVLEQGGIDRDTFAKMMPTAAAQIDEAMQSGGLVSIPLGELAASLPGTGLEQKMVENLKAAPDAPSQIEAQEFYQSSAEEFKKEAEKILAQHEVDSVFAQSSSKVYKTFFEQFNAANRFTPDVNDAYAKLIAAFYTTQAAKRGITPEQAFNEHPLRVQAETPVGGRQMDQMDLPAAQAHAAAILAHHVANGGGTWDLRTGKENAGQPGFAVSAYKGREAVIQGAPSVDQIADYIKAHADALSRPGAVLGTWANPEDGNTYLDVSQVARDREEAMRIARENNQLAIFDLQNFTTIDTEPAPLIGLPRAPVAGRIPGPFAKAQQAAREYMAKAGLPYDPPQTYAKVDPIRAKRIADAYDQMRHAPDDPEVAAAYAAMIEETIAQWKAIEATGLKVQFLKPGMADPYAESPRLAIIDAVENNHLWVFPTDFGYGSEGDRESETQLKDTDNPMLKLTDIVVDGKQLVANDVFRIVHDYFGHIKDGVGFRAEGEENAWRAHSAMYSPLARRAMTAETRGQNSWVNFGPHGATNRKANAADTVYAPQKIGLLPEWVSNDGARDLEMPSYGVSRPDGVDVVAAHFSPEPRTVLFGNRYGTGYKGAERAEVMAASDNRIKSRTHFYLPNGAGVVPETGVGTAGHAVVLKGMYDADADVLRLWEQGKTNAEREAAVIDAGFTGYITRNFGNNQGAAIVFGDKGIPVQYVGTAQDINRELAGRVVPQPQYSQSRALANDILAVEGLPAGQLTPQAWGEQFAKASPELHARMESFGAFAGTGTMYRDELARKVKAAADAVQSTELNQGDGNGDNRGNSGPDVQADENAFTSVSGRSPEQGWAEATRVRRADGPATLYRGAAVALTADHFEAGALGYASGNPSSGLGVWFTVRRSEAERYGPVVEGFKFDIRKLKVMTFADLEGFESVEEAYALQQKYRAEGYEGILLSGREIGAPAHMVVFDADSVLRSNTLEQKAFHGTPHDFDKFSTDHIGSGEGFQAFGWGLYFATNRLVAEHYHDMLAGAPTMVSMKLGSMQLNERNGFDYTRNSGRSTKDNLHAKLAEDIMIGEQLLPSKTPEQFHKHVLSILDGYVEQYAPDSENWPEGVAAAKQLKADLKSPSSVAVKFEQRTGGVYEVEIPDEAVDRMLDWYKTYDEQPASVRAALKAMGIDYGREGNRSVTGGEIYDDITNVSVENGTAGNNPKRATSEMLDAAGIPGVKYADGSSRGDPKKSQTHNIVVFDDSIIKLTHKDGTPVSAKERLEYFQGPEVSDFLTGSVVQHVVYHGTSKDVDFKKFKQARNGIWFAADPADASSYAMENDSQGAKYENGKFVDKNTASRVMKVYLSLRNPMVYEKWPEELATAANYKRAQGILFDKLRAEGYDGVVGPGGTYVVFSPEQIKTATGNPRTLGQGPRGKITLPPQGVRGQTSVITLLNNADLSTFLHEAGHFFLEVMGDVAQQPNPPQQIVDDLNALMKWFGHKGTIEQWYSLPIEVRREAHEQFARGFESYLFEGRSPNVTLNSVFAKFRSWLISVYKTISSLRVNLTDEVRGVMDRMIASEEQITHAEAARGYTPIFRDRPEGMSDQEWESYQTLGADATETAVAQLQSRSMRDMQWLTNARSRALKALQKSAATKRKMVRAEVAAEVNAEPVYRAMAFLKTGMLDGEQLVGAKLSLSVLKEMYGEGPAALWRYFPTGTQSMVTSDPASLSPDQVAEMFGFTSGDEIVRSLLAAEDIREKIEGLTDQRMLERYGDLSDQQAQERAADEAVHNEARGRFVATELAALEKATGKPKTLAAAARDFAKEIIDRKKISDIKPHQYAAAETRNGASADKAFKAGDLVAAATEKRNQLVNHYAERAAMSALDRVEKDVAYLKKIADSELIDREYREQIQTLLERFDLRKVSARDIEKRASLLQWVEKQKSLGFEPTIDEELLNEARRVPYRSLTLEEFNGLVDTVRNIAHLGKLKHKLLKLRDRREFEAVVKEVSDSIINNAKRVIPVEISRNSWTSRMKSGVAEFFVWHRKFASMMREMDGYQDGGVLFNTFVRPANEAGDHEAVMREEATVKLSALMEPILKTGKMGRRMFIKEINASLDREARIMVALNTGNEGNLQRLMDGDRWSIQQVQAVVDTLTKEEMDFVQSVWDLVVSYRDQIGAQQKNLTGVEPKWIEPIPVVTRHGTYKGGYLPAKYDTNRSTRSLSDEAAAGVMDQWRAARGSAKTRDSFTKGRAAKVMERPLRKDFGVVTQHITEVTHRLAWQEYLIDAQRLLRAGPIDHAIREHYGSEVLEALRKMVEDIAAGEVGAQNAFESGINYLRQGATIAGLGWRVTTSLLQPLGLTQSMVRIGPKWVGKGLAEWMGDSVKMESTAKKIFDKSDMMRLRAKTMQREISEIRNKVSGRASAIEASYFYLIQKMQLVADIPTWLGQYHKAVEGGANEEAAIAQADQAVLDAQGGGQIKDLAGAQRGGPLQKMFTNFYSFFNTTYNLTSESVGRTNFKDPLSVGRMAVDMLLLYSVPAVLGTLMKAALKGDDDPEKLKKQLIADQLTYLFGTMVGLREIAGTVVLKTFGLPGDYTGPAALRVVDALGKAAQQAGQGEADVALLKSLDTVGGILFHYPSGQINATAEGIKALLDGTTRNPGALLVGPHKN